MFKKGLCLKIMSLVVTLMIVSNNGIENIYGYENNEKTSCVTIQSVNKKDELSTQGHLYEDFFCYFDTENMTATILRYDGPVEGDIYIPSCIHNEYNGGSDFTVTAIGPQAFMNRWDLKGRIFFPDSIVSISSNAFANSGFTGELILPKNLVSIGYGAFDNCAGFTGNLIIPDGVSTIEEHTFRDCKGFNGKLVLPSKLTSIKNEAFSGCKGLRGTLELPTGLNEIKAMAFYYCSGLTGDLIIPNKITTIESYVFGYCSGFSGNLQLPSRLESVEEGAFIKCSGLVGRLLIPSKCTKIGNYAFEGCLGFTGDLDLPDKITKIGREAFMGCYGLNGSLILPQNLKSVDDKAFYGLNKIEGNLNLPDAIESIGTSAFEGCSGITGKLYFPNSVSTLSDRAFTRCNSIDCLVIGRINEIGSSCFKDCSGVKKIVFYDEPIDQSYFNSYLYSIFPSNAPKYYYPLYANGWTSVVSKYSNLKWIPYNYGETPWEMDNSSVTPAIWFSTLTKDALTYKDNAYSSDNIDLEVNILAQSVAGSENPIYNNIKYNITLPYGLSFDKNEDIKEISGTVDALSLQEGYESKKTLNYEVFIDENIVTDSFEIKMSLIADDFEKELNKTYEVPVKIILEDVDCDESIINVVDRYTNQEEINEVVKIINSSHSNEIKRKQLLEYYHYDNMLDVADRVRTFSATKDERWDYNGLIQDDIYTAWQWYNYLNNTTKGKINKAALYAGGLVFNDELDKWLDPSTYEDGSYPGVEKYKDMLKQFITYQSEKMELVSYMMQTESFISKSVGLCSTVEKGEILSELGKAKSTVACKSIFNNFVTSKIKDLDGKQIVIDYEEKTPLMEYLGVVDSAFKINKIAVDGLNDFMEVNTNIELYNIYHDFLYNEIYVSTDLPWELRLAAYQLDEELRLAYWMPVQNMLNKVRDMCIDKAMDAMDIKSLSDLIDGGGYLKTIKYTSFCINQFADVGSMVVNSCQTEGYVYLTNHYRNKLIRCKESFLSNRTEENAWEFYDTYNMLWKLRMAGEEKFLSMNKLEGGKVVDNIQEGVSGTTLAQIISEAFDYKYKEEIINENLLMLKDFEFVHVKKNSGDDKLYQEKAMIGCPVDVDFYMDGLKVATLKNGIKQDFSNKNGRFVSVYRATEGEWVKIAYFDKTNPISIELTSTDAGQVSYSFIKKVDDENILVNGFDNVLIKSNDIIKIDSDRSDYSIDIDGDGNDDIIANIADKNKVYVQFDYQNKHDIKVIYVKSDGKITMPANPQRDGYKFAGWYSEPDGKGDLFDGRSQIKQSTTVYALWENDTIEHPEDPETPNEPGTPSDNAPKKTGTPSDKFDYSKFSHVKAEDAIATNGCIIAAKGKFDVKPYIQGATRFKSSDKKIASVSGKKGLVKGKKSGEVTITGQVKSGKNWVDVGTYTVHVVVPEIQKRNIKNMDASASISGNEIIENETLIPTSWKSSKPEVASVDETTGEIRIGSKRGTTKITAYYGSGKNAAKYKFKMRVKTSKSPSNNSSSQEGNSSVANVEAVAIF